MANPIRSKTKQAPAEMARLLGAGRSLNLLSNQAVRQITALVLLNENRIRLTVSSSQFFCQPSLEKRQRGCSFLQEVDYSAREKP